ncbi:hypothetical protein Tco_1413388 [Tanacetum coccineum]
MSRQLQGVIGSRNLRDLQLLTLNGVLQNLLILDSPNNGPAFNLLKGTCKSFMELEYHFKECYKVVTDQLDWNNPEGHEYPFDLSKPLPLIEAQGRQVVPVDYFFNNDLEYLKGGNYNRKYTTSTTKTKAARYDNIEGIEDMVPELWSPVKVACDKFAMWAKYRKTRKGETNMRRLSQVRRIMHRDQVRKHLKEAQGRQVVPADYFNNDLEYLKGGSYNRKYTTSTTKIKAARYDNIEGIEDMVPELWSPVKVAYDKFAMWGISH